MKRPATAKASARPNPTATAVPVVGPFQMRGLTREELLSLIPDVDDGPRGGWRPPPPSAEAEERLRRLLTIHARDDAAIEAALYDINTFIIPSLALVDLERDWEGVRAELEGRHARLTTAWEVLDELCVAPKPLGARADALVDNVISKVSSTLARPLTPRTRTAFRFDPLPVAAARREAEEMLTVLETALAALRSKTGRPKGTPLTQYVRSMAKLWKRTTGNNGTIIRRKTEDETDPDLSDTWTNGGPFLDFCLYGGAYLPEGSRPSPEAIGAAVAAVSRALAKLKKAKEAKVAKGARAAEEAFADRAATRRRHRQDR